MSSKEYKSPPHKLIKFFKNSRDSWEDVAKKRRDEIRDLKKRALDLQTSRDSWKEKARTAIEEAQSKEEVLQNTQNELNDLKAVQENLQRECEDLKKKEKQLQSARNGIAILRGLFK